ncbi:putative cytokinetic ring protein SteA [Actinopolymorpha sp. B17G11]|uniref:putative cytokinetic ring protein SteA n=1 Tax=unclassified Actinopolymorpha TaxID=2627063 RepID=UPI0032D95A43
MRLPTLRRTRPARLPGVSGPARLDSRVDQLLKRLRPGDVAVLRHVDLDRVAAEAMVAAGVAAVVNAAPSISGRYPNLGPGVLVAAGIPLVDGAGMGVFGRVSDGDMVRLDGPALFHGDLQVAFGVEQTANSIEKATAAARAGLVAQLEAFTADTIEHLRRNHDLLLESVGVPDIDTRLAGRHVLIAVRGAEISEDLASLRAYIREYRPVLIGVDGGADSLLAAGHTPDIIVGDMELVPDGALRCGAELVVQGDRDGSTAGTDRLERIGLDSRAFDAPGASEDLAVLLADAKGARLIVVAGTSASLLDLLDRGRSGAPSTLLTRLRAGAKLVDAKAAGELCQSRIQTWHIVLLVIAGLLALLVALAATPVAQDWLASGWAWSTAGWERMRG